MIHFNTELRNNHKLCALKVLNERETNQVTKEEKLAKAKMSRHNLIMSQQKLKAASRGSVATSSAMSQQRQS